MPSHRVEQGESLYSIAAQHKLARWEALRDHAGNRSLMQKRPHPQILHPGDVLQLPDAAEEGLPVALDGRTQFTRRAKNTQPLSLTLRHVDGSPIANTPFRLEHDHGTVDGRTNGDGALDTEVPIGTRKCTLTAGAYVFELQVAHLNPLRDTDDQGLSGCQGRLRNLGFFAGEIDGRESPELADAIGLFQVANELPRTGKLDAATRDKLAAQHGC